MPAWGRRILPNMKSARHRWTAGEVLSWALGVTLGLVLGVAILILTPRLMSSSQSGLATAPANEAGTTNGVATGGEAEDAAAGTEDAAASSGGTGAAQGTTGSEATGGETAGSAQGEGAAQGGETGQTPAQGAGVAGTGQAGGAQSAGGAPAGGGAAAGDPQAGQTLYVSNCSGCHGNNGQGAIGPSLVREGGAKSWSDPEFLVVLRQGKTPQRELNNTMPRYTEQQLSDQDAYNIHAYIKSL